MKNRKESEIFPLGEPVKALEEDFFMPVTDHTWFGQPLQVFIKNKTGGIGVKIKKDLSKHV